MTVQICKKSVYIDGEKLDLMSGEVHYWRLERHYWEKVLDRLIEAGLGMVATYVPWRVHMPIHGRADFATGSLNLRAFLELADTLGLKVFLRPGPLIVSEMECGGLPDYLFEEEDILARNAAGDISRGGICFSHKGVVSYLHPRYLDYVREWLSAVHEAVWDFYHQNGGPITILQLDNEVSYVCRDAIFESDYNEIVIGEGGLYQQWLSRKYGTSLPYPYTGPPRELPSNLEENLALYLDWVEFKEDLLAEYIAILRRTYEDLGVRDILYATNFNPHNAISVPTNWAKMERATSGITGYDFYKWPFMPFRDWARMALVCAYADAVTRVPWSPEFMCGIWGEDFGDGFGAVPAEHLEFMSLCAFAFGLKGLNYYMFAEREEWSFCPVNQFGQKRYTFEALRKIVQFTKRVNLSEYSARREIALLFYRPYGWFSYVEDSFPCADIELEPGKLQLDGDPNGISYIDFQSLFSRLLQLGFLPAIVDPDENPSRLRDCSVVIVPAQTRMDEHTLGLLESFSREGGRVIFSPAPPSKNLDGKPLPMPMDWANSIGQRLPHDKPGDEDEDSLRLLANAVRLKPFVRTGNRFVLAVLLESTRDGLLFVMNVNPRAKHVRLEMDAPVAVLRDVFSGEECRLVNGGFELEVDCKSCRVFRIP